MTSLQFGNGIGPTIGVTSRWCGSQPDALPHPYLKVLRDLGARPRLMDIDRDETELAREVLDLDGLLLTGGGDVEPSRYGEEQHPQCRGVSTRRDRAEMAVIRAAVAADKPLLAICRGIQVLNVALGGSLYQDVPSQIASPLTHRTKGRDELIHRVRLEPGSQLATCLRAEEVSVNSLHHQGVKRLGQGLLAVGRSGDGLVEAVEMPGKRFVIGVQWHPEELVGAVEHARRLFECFLAAASPGGRA